MKPSGKRILWVDDEIDLLKPHLLFLQARGYHVDAITNGDDSLGLMRENAYDLYRRLYEPQHPQSVEGVRRVSTESEPVRGLGVRARGL